MSDDSVRVSSMRRSAVPDDRARDIPLDEALGARHRLRRRSDFLNVAKGRRFYSRSLTLQCAPSRETPARTPRFGFTVTKKIGGAVVRNRIRRRLKAALRLLEPLPARIGHDYVIVARSEALHVPFAALRAELAESFGGLDKTKLAKYSTRHKNSKGKAPQA